VKLFLDDLRSPPDASWDVVRSYEEHVGHIESHGTPDVISFDHDLGDEVPTGMDCAKWLVEIRRLLAEFVVHSANPPDSLNIASLLESWRKFCWDNERS
jgi:hypothetical protein